MFIVLAIVVVIGAIAVLAFRLLTPARQRRDSQPAAFDAADPATPRPPTPGGRPGRRGDLDVHQPES
jgi:hypothetical protein